MYLLFLQYHLIEGPMTTVTKIMMMINSPITTVKTIPTKLPRGRPPISIWIR